MTDDKRETIARIEKIFNTASDYFDAPALSFWDRFGWQTIDRLSLNRGDRVLDICCGSGASAIPAAYRVGDSGYVLAVDLAESLLDLARKKAKQQNLANITFQRQDFESLDFPDACFDAIVCVFGIFFVSDMTAAISNLWRIIRPGGKLAITSWGKNVFEPANRIFWETIASERPDLYKTFTPWDRISEASSLQALLEAGGATNVEVFAETGTHALQSPEDWWTMVLGGGLRGTIELLDPETKERVRQTNLQYLQTNGASALDVDVLYAVASK